MPASSSSLVTSHHRSTLLAFITTPPHLCIHRRQQLRKKSAFCLSFFSRPEQRSSSTSFTNRYDQTWFIFGGVDGNLDERINDRVLYEILIQAGSIVDLHIPRDRETNRQKGYAFAEYETEEIAEYAVRLFSGLVSIYNRMLKFAISGKDKPSQNLSATISPISNSSPNPRSHPQQFNSVETSQHYMKLSMPCRFSANPPSSAQEPSPPGVVQPNGYGSDYNSNNNSYNRRVLGATWDSISRSNSSRYDSRNPITYPSY
ncbi:hypothetical protein HHK36_004570 [Tetracentron sinense]|uniref:RRM domain-containing protein n=1 Tax=Tetracentron sinense TaxID=13715 RepID=A0A835A074_TETSI|nr:hypothetical protein HHK36_004570 [Tetracentron sinense]